jgi:NTP pyrophosphatase (non-canonical NTP hydrolase)
MAEITTEITFEDKKQRNAILEILAERNRQDLKWGEQNHAIEKWTPILGEEFGELCEAINETIFDNGSDKGGYENVRKEAIHVAAVAVGFLECIERNKEVFFPEGGKSE